MKQVIPFFITLLLFASCSQQRYAHRAKVKMKPSEVSKEVDTRLPSVMVDEQIAMVQEVANEEAFNEEIKTLEKEEAVNTSEDAPFQSSASTFKSVRLAKSVLKEVKSLGQPNLPVNTQEQKFSKRISTAVVAPASIMSDLPKGETWFKLIVLGLILVLVAIIVRLLLVTIGNIIGAIGAVLILLGVLLFLFEML